MVDFRWKRVCLIPQGKEWEPDASVRCQLLSHSSGWLLLAAGREPSGISTYFRMTSPDGSRRAATESNVSPDGSRRAATKSNVSPDGSRRAATESNASPDGSRRAATKSNVSPDGSRRAATESHGIGR